MIQRVRHMTLFQSRALVVREEIFLRRMQRTLQPGNHYIVEGGTETALRMAAKLEVLKADVRVVEIPRRPGQAAQLPHHLYSMMIGCAGESWWLQLDPDKGLLPAVLDAAAAMGKTVETFELWSKQ